MSKASLSFLSEEEIGAIHNASLQVLENTGIKVTSKKALDILKEAGARVDYEKNLAAIPRNLVEEALRRAPKTIKFCARNPKYDVLLDKKGTYFMTGGMDLPYVTDLETGERRTSTIEDVARWARIADYLDNVHFVYVTLAAADVPPKMRCLTQFVTTLSNTEKHVEYEAHSAREAQYMVEIAAAIVGSKEELRKRPIISAMQMPISPLMFEEGSIEASIEFARAGIPVAYIDEPLAMETSPATLAGTLVTTNAENLAGLVISEFASPEAPVLYATTACTADPSSGAIVESSEANLLNLASAQIAHYYGLPFATSVHGSQSKTLDAQAGYEMSAGVNQSLNANIIMGLGVLDSGGFGSLEKLVVDNEIADGALRFARGLEVNDDTLAVDIIHKVGPGGIFLGEKHTLKHYKELGVPKLSDRSTFATWEKKGSKPIDEVAKEKVKEILSIHKPAPIAEEVQGKISQILKRAEAEFLKEES